MKYNNYIKTLASNFERRIEDISAEYNFDYGDEFEIAICEILRDFLPSKFGICRGFVVSEDGQTAGDDIIIYDQERFPTLKLRRKDVYARKENIPIEAVYAYIEAKHNLTSSTLEKAFNQIIEVKRIVNLRPKAGLEQYDPYITFETNQNEYSPDYPKYRNPVFTMIISRYITNDKGSREKPIVEKLLNDRLKELEKGKNPNFPELIIAGNNLYGHIAYTEGNGDIKPTIFLNDDKNYFYFTMAVNEYSFGIGLTNLFAALDWIRLGKMPWVEMMNESMFPTK